METRNFDFFGDSLTVTWTGSVWVSPSNGQQHSRLSGAVRAECESYLSACGADAAAEADAIESAIEAARAAPV